MVTEKYDQNLNASDAALIITVGKLCLQTFIVIDLL